jgi:hypothetical protein
MSTSSWLFGTDNQLIGTVDSSNPGVFPDLEFGGAVRENYPPVAPLSVFILLLHARACLLTKKQSGIVALSSS